MGWILSSKYSYVPQNVTLFGDRGFFGGNQVKKRSLGWALIHMTGVLMTGNLETDPLTRRTPCEHEDGRLTSQEERPGGDPSLTALRGYQPRWHLCFRLLTSGTSRQFLLSHPVSGILLTAAPANEYKNKLDIRMFVVGGYECVGFYFSHLM